MGEPLADNRSSTSYQRSYPLETMLNLLIRNLQRKVQDTDPLGGGCRSMPSSTKKMASWAKREGSQRFKREGREA